MPANQDQFATSSHAFMRNHSSLSQYPNLPFRASMFDKKIHMPSLLRESTSTSTSQAGQEPEPSSSSGTTEEQNPHTKPPYSYVALITMAIKDSRDQQLPLRGIYNYISCKFPYYKRESRGWQNSIRHNLSLNQCFVKKPVDCTRPGERKGNLWTLHPSYENMFEDGNYKRRKKIRKIPR